MTAELYRDVPDCLTELARAGIKTYIYSSGSREAQRLFFGHTQVGLGLFSRSPLSSPASLGH
jgi:methionine salvage enolase-phosphatase E1